MHRLLRLPRAHKIYDDRKTQGEWNLVCSATNLLILSGFGLLGARPSHALRMAAGLWPPRSTKIRIHSSMHMTANSV